MTAALDTVHALFREWLALDGGAAPEDVLDVPLATVLANRMDGDPLWMLLVGAPSSGKTEVLRALDTVPDVYPLSSLTAHTLASGFERRGAPTSLLPKLDGKVIVMKDFGTVLTMHRDARAEILAQLREIYDGAYTKEYGTGKRFDWAGKVGLLAAVTGVIDREYAFASVLGERFLSCRITHAETRTLARRALAQRQREPESRRALRDAVAALLADTGVNVPGLPGDRAEGICALAELVAHGRAPVIFDRQGEIELIPGAEGPGRLTKQLALLAHALAALRGEPEVSPRTYQTVVRVAWDSLPLPRRLLLAALLDAEGYPTKTTTAAYAQTMGYPTSTARRYLQELVAVGLADRHSEGAPHPDRWVPSARLHGLLDDARAPVPAEALARTP